jgi:hypothetical protein
MSEMSGFITFLTFSLDRLVPKEYNLNVGKST